MQNNTQNNDTDIGMQDITRGELARIDGGGFWSALGCGIVAAIAEGATNNVAVGVDVFMGCYY
jgi:hypothetical protein